MNPDKCRYPFCRQPACLTYGPVRMCSLHWDTYCAIGGDGVDGLLKSRKFLEIIGVEVLDDGLIVEMAKGR